MFSSKIKLALLNVMTKFGYRMYRPNPYTIFDFESFLTRHLAVHGHLSYVQIGANDGILNDPMFGFLKRNSGNISGYLLEPIPTVYNSLIRNYRKFQGLKFFNYAIHETNSSMQLYKVKEERQKGLPDFTKGIASFDSEHWIKTTLVPDSSYIEAINVPCIPLSKFLEINSIKNLDLLIVDTEGYDFDIISSLLDTSLRPRIIRFEHGVRNEIMTKSQFSDICVRLNLSGYQIIAESYDATAYFLDPNDLIF
jgi:FkbM family methyltransferase